MRLREFLHRLHYDEEGYLRRVPIRISEAGSVSCKAEHILQTREAHRQLQAVGRIARRKHD